MIQGSDEWKLARCGSLGASDFHDIIAQTKTGYATSRANRKAALVVERLTGRTLETYQSAAMAQGLERQAPATAAYSFLMNVDVEEIGLIPHPTIAHTHASPDGLIAADGLLEIKSMQPAAHLNLLLTGVIEVRYATQMAWQLSCSGRAWVDFCAYNPDFPEAMQLWVKRIYRDDDLIARLEKEAIIFLQEVDATVAELRKRYALEQAA